MQKVKLCEHGQKWLWSQTSSQNWKLSTLSPYECLHCSRASKPVLQSSPPRTLVWKWATSHQPSLLLGRWWHGSGTKDSTRPLWIHTSPKITSHKEPWSLWMAWCSEMAQPSWATWGGGIKGQGCSRAAQSGLSLSCSWLRLLRPSWDTGQLRILLVWCVKLGWITSFHAAVKSNPVPKYHHMGIWWVTPLVQIMPWSHPSSFILTLYHRN